VFDGAQTGAGILCKLTDGDYENAFYDFANFAGGKALDKLGVRIKENPEKYSQKVHAAYKRANAAYEALMKKKNDDERDRLIKKTLEKYNIGPPPPRGEDDVDPSGVMGDESGSADKATGKTSAPPASGSQAPPATPGSAELERAFEEAKKSMQDVGKDFRNLGEGLKKIFK